ncbi:MAG TPA: pitrilysin family protein [Bacteriovoracaceae bacterium]|nr:pitrilysin family protein [Bacteriovoracaceae bacterium]
MKLWFLLIALLFGCSTVKKDKEDIKGLSESINLEVKEVKLSNGMTALIIPNPKLPIFSLYMFYKVGGKNEVPGITGASHFLEHMMFKGAKKFGKNTIDFIIEGSGGSTNAYTTNDQTVYYENLPSSQLAIMLEIEADRMENLLLDVDDFTKEREVVLEERKMRYENSPRGQLYLELMQSLYEGTPYGRSVIGDIPDLKSVTREQIQKYFKRFYAPNNVTLVLSGDVNPAMAEELIRKQFGSIPSSPSVDEAHKSLKDEDFAPKIKTSKVLKRNGESPNPMFMMAYPSYKAGHPTGYALDVLSSILGSGKSSALMSDYILTNNPVATKMYASNSSLEKSGFFYFGGDLVKGVKLDEFRKDLENRVKGYCSTEITDKNLLKIKNNYLIDLYAGLDTNAGLAQFLGERQLLFGDWRYYKQELGMYEKVTVDEVKKACVDIFSQPSVFVSVWDKHKRVKK